MAFTAQDVKNLREATGVGMMDCKKALTECNGDFDAAVEFLRKKGLASAAKKANRIAAEGVVCCELSADGKIGALLEVNCETDFVAKGEAFNSFVKAIAAHIVASNPADVDALLKSSIDGVVVDDMVKENTAKIGEKLSIRRFARYEVKENGVVSSYIHMGGKIGVVVEFGCNKAETVANEDFKLFVKDVAMQVAAVSPRWVTRSEVPADVLDKERAIYREQTLAEGKPEKMVDKIVEGKLGKLFYSNNCLIDMVFVKDDSKKISDLVAEVSKATGDTIAIKAFTRYTLGEGLEKRSNDLAAEVAAEMAKYAN